MDHASAHSAAAFRVFMIVYSSAFLLSFGTGALDLGWAFDNFLPLATAAIIFSSVLSIYLYMASFGRGRLLAAAGNSGGLEYCTARHALCLRQGATVSDACTCLQQGAAGAQDAGQLGTFVRECRLIGTMGHTCTLARREDVAWSSCYCRSRSGCKGWSCC